MKKTKQQSHFCPRDEKWLAANYKSAGRKRLFPRLFWLQAGIWLILLMGLTGCRDQGSAVMIQADATAQRETKPSEEREEISLEAAPSAADPLETAPQKHVYVHVCGQVKEPGVYVLEEGSRVWDAVTAAGGLTEEADPESVNLAWVVADGSKITIPSQAQSQEGAFSWYQIGTGDPEDLIGQEESSLAEHGVERLDLNRATVEELMTIPGIGQSRAQAIVAYRQAHGSFQSIQDIMQVAGIKEGLFDAIREYITVGG